jgi:y4mF family transcriptional regulator
MQTNVVMLDLLTNVARPVMRTNVDRSSLMRINTMHDLAASVRGRRLELNLSQTELAARVGVSRDWVSFVENGKLTVELGLVLRLLDGLGLRVELLEAGGGAAPTVDLDVLLDEHRRR